MPAPGGRGAAGAHGVGRGLGCQVLPAVWGGTPPLLPAPPRARPRRGETGTWVAPVPEAAHPRPRPASLPPPAPQSPQIPPPPRAPRTPSPAAPAFLPPPRREPRAHGAHLGYALSSHALQNSLRAAECRKTPRPPKVGRRPSSTTSSHSPRCLNCPRERGRCGWSREAPAPGLPPSNQSKHPPPPQGRQAWASDGATWARCWASDPPPTSAQCPPNSQGKRDLATVDTCDPNPPPPVGTRLWGLSGLSRAPPHLLAAPALQEGGGASEGDRQVKPRPRPQNLATALGAQSWPSRGQLAQGGSRAAEGPDHHPGRLCRLPEPRHPDES